ncbi:MAG: ATP-binding protein [Promethearchaeota archaeon]
MELSISMKDIIALFENVDDAIIITSLDGIILGINPKAEIISGWSAKNAANRNIKDILSISDSELNKILKFKARRRYKKGEKIFIENLNIIRFGERVKIPVIAKGQPIIAGDEVKAILLIIKMMSESSRMSSMLWDAFAQIWDFSRTSSDILDSMPFAIFICKPVKNDQLIILDCNPAAIELIGMTGGKIRNERLEDVWGQYKQLDLNAVISSVLRKNEVYTKEYSVFNDNKELVVAYNVRIFPIPRKRIGIFIEDITSLKKAELILERENIRLKELNEMRQEFILNSTHELKTPLVSLYGATNFLLQSYKDRLDPDTLNLINLIYRGAIRLMKLINTLLDISKIEVNKLRLEKRKADFVSVIRSAVAEIDYYVQQRKCKIDFDMPDSLYLTFDKLRIEQVVLNLLSNALKNSKSGGKILIRLVKDTENNRAVFSIKDNGVGITKEEMKLLFSKFGKIERNATKFNIDIQGSGLGLYISKEFISRHGGRIWAESEGRNKGSTFYFTLPLTSKDDD